MTRQAGPPAQLGTFLHPSAAAKFAYLAYRYRFLFNYILIGGISISVEVVIRHFLLRVAQPLGATVLAVATGILTAYILNVRFNFKVPKAKRQRALILFVLISLFSVVLNFTLKSYLSSLGLGYAEARFVSGGLLFLIAYTLHRRFTFSDAKRVGVAVYADNKEDIRALWEKVGAFPDFIHVDIVDESFNPAVAAPSAARLEVVRAFWPNSEIHVHLMSRTPSKWLAAVEAYCDRILVHCEIDEDVALVLDEIKRAEKKSGVCFRIGTPPERVKAFLSHTDMVLILSIAEPGRSGQSFLQESIDVVDEINRWPERKDFSICVDGGVSEKNIGSLSVENVVAASAILNHPQPHRQIMRLRTSSNYEALTSMPSADALAATQGALAATFGANEAVRSVTVVGSLADGVDPARVADIDAVVVVDNLTPAVFHACVREAEKLTAGALGFPSRDLLLNTTFGPRKLDTVNSVVLHLMIYDAAGHRDHVQQSPFTCFDWERHQPTVGKSLAAICPVLSLQPSDFFLARRGLGDYLADLARGVVSVREYEWKNDKPGFTVKAFPLDDRHRSEFAYHIFNNTISNYAKLVAKNNRRPVPAALLAFWKEHLPGSTRHIPLYEQLRNAKQNRSASGPLDMSGVREFAADVFTDLNAAWTGPSEEVVLVRHLPTGLDDKTFLGQGRNPGIASAEISLQGKFGAVWTSPARRATETAQILAGGSGVQADARLHEQNCGLAEGITLAELRQRFPDVEQGWREGRDVAFPEGENLQQVSARGLQFLEERIMPGALPSLVVSHNVVIRCIIGSLIGLPMRSWFRIPVKHGDPVRIRKYRGVWHALLTTGQRAAIREAVAA